MVLWNNTLNMWCPYMEEELIRSHVSVRTCYKKLK